MQLPPKRAGNAFLKQAKVFYGKRKNVYTVAKNVLEKGLTYSFCRPQVEEKGIQDLVDCPYQCSVRAEGLNLFYFYS